MTDLRTAAQQALAFTMRDFASLRDFEAAKAVLHDNLRTALAQQAEPVQDQRCRAEPRSDGDFVCDCKIGDCLGRNAALAQQDEPQGCATEEECTYQPWCRIRGTCQRKQADPDISRCPRCGSAADNGHDRELPPNPYFCSRCMAQQTETVEPVAWRWGYRSVTTGEMDWRGYVEIAAHPNLRSPEIIIEPLYTAPPQRTMVPLTEKEMYAVEEEARKNFRLSQKGPRGQQITYWDGLTPWLIRAVEKASWEKNK